MFDSFDSLREEIAKTKSRRSDILRKTAFDINFERKI